MQQFVAAAGTIQLHWSEGLIPAPHTFHLMSEGNRGRRGCDGTAGPAPAISHSNTSGARS